MDTDGVVVGGGSAGLQAALTLGRMRFDVVVVDAGRPSNAPAHSIGGVLRAPDLAAVALLARGRAPSGGLLGAHDLAPLELLERGRAQIAELPSVRLVGREATRVDAGGAVTLGDG